VRGRCWEFCSLKTGFVVVKLRWINLRYADSVLGGKRTKFDPFSVRDTQRQRGARAPIKNLPPGRLHGKAYYLSFICIACWNGHVRREQP